MAVVLNSVDNELKAVELDEVTGHEACVRVLFLCGCKRVFLLWRFLFLSCIRLTFWNLFTLGLGRHNIDDNLVGFTGEHTLNSIKG